jgi:hypothetical protein
MMLPRYELKADESLTVFEFVSVGVKGEISRIVQYSETNLKGRERTVRKEKPKNK